MEKKKTLVYLEYLVITMPFRKRNAYRASHKYTSSFKKVLAILIYEFSPAAKQSISQMFGKFQLR